MIKNKLSLYFVFISIFTTISGFISIVQKSYSNLIGPSQKIDSTKFMSKINPMLDASVIQEIQSRSENIDIDDIKIIDDSSENSDSLVSTKTNEASSSVNFDQTADEE